jgi:hypothetical protein
MNEFENIQNLWNSQSLEIPHINAHAIINKAIDQKRALTRKHRWTIVILSVTVIVLIYYFFWLQLFQISYFTIGLSIMILTLFFRIVLEIHSAIKLKKIDPSLTLFKYSQQVSSFYTSRKMIHYLLTPIIYMGYFLGFTMLLPTFKEEFSAGFYLYCLISGYGFMIIFSFIIIRQIKSEIKLIERLQNLK